MDCETCQEEYYPNDEGFCALRSKSIQGCKYYLGQSLYKECQTGYYLTYDGENCYKNPGFDLNCQNFTYQTKCSVCRSGYYLKDGNCLKCLTENSCMFCDP